MVDEIEIKELQDKKVLADVSIKPIKFIHSKKENFKKHTDNIQEAFEQAQAEYKNECMYLSQYEPTNKIITDLSTKILNAHKNWNALILFDYTLSGESLFQLLNWQNKHYIDRTS